MTLVETLSDSLRSSPISLLSVFISSSYVVTSSISKISADFDVDSQDLSNVLTELPSLPLLRSLLFILRNLLSGVSQLRDAIYPLRYAREDLFPDNGYQR